MQGVSLRIGCSPEGAELPLHLSLLAEYGRKPHAFARIDLNGSRHPNAHAVCGSMQFVDAGKTHFHDTRLHLGMPIDKLFNSDWDLPIAQPIGDIPDNFLKLMEKCGEMLHIENLTEVEEPQWQPRQFPF